ncbi:MAG TPA: hypothetical protein VGE59_00450 [Patescibacteria group bacterium]
MVTCGADDEELLSEGPIGELQISSMAAVVAIGANGKAKVTPPPGFRFYMEGSVLMVRPAVPEEEGIAEEKVLCSRNERVLRVFRLPFFRSRVVS